MISTRGGSSVARRYSINSPQVVVEATQAARVISTRPQTAYSINSKRVNFPKVVE